MAQTAQDILESVFGLTAFRGFQKDVIETVAAGGDALVLMPTGGGKSLCYQIPALMRSGMAVVVSPLIALMADQVRALSDAGVKAAYLNSTLAWPEVADIKRRAAAGDVDILYVAPERLVLESTLQFLSTVRLSLFAIDEAHCVSMWGHDFRPEYAQLSVLRERWPEVPRIALTATADLATREEICERLLVNPKRFVASFDRPNIRYRIVEKDHAQHQLTHFIEDEHRGESGIVYCLSRAKAESTAEKLVARGINARAYHAGMDSQMRHDNQAWFINTPGAVICATIAFGMGIDKPDVRFVAHIDMPKSIENYFQETGRAGRDGKPAQAWMCYGHADVVNQMRLIEMSDADDLYKRRSSIKLDAMLALAETVHCRRKLLLNYFGEEAPETCGNCDNCLEPPEIIDATVAAQKLVSCIWRCNKLSGHTFGARHIVDVLLGNPTEKVFAEGHDKLSTFGIGKDLDPDQWRRLIRQLIVLRILTVDAERYSALALAGGRASELLKGKIRVTMRKNGLTATKAKSGGAGTKKNGTRPKRRAFFLRHCVPGGLKRPAGSSSPRTAFSGIRRSKQLRRLSPGQSKRCAVSIGSETAGSKNTARPCLRSSKPLKPTTPACDLRRFRKKRGECLTVRLSARFDAL